MSTDALLTTRDAAQRLGVGPSTIKRWADEGVLECVRTAGGHRRFPVDRVEALLQNHRSPPRDFVDEWVQLLTTESDEYHVLSAIFGLRAREGAWYHVCDRLGAVLEEIGDRWARGSLSVAGEHAASERLHRALTRATETMAMSKDQPGALLCLPDGEQHAFGLYFTELVCREAGFHTRAMTRPLPDHEIVDLVHQTNARVVVLTASASSSAERLQVLLQRVAPIVQARRLNLVVGGRGPWPEPLPAGVRIQHFSGFRSYLDALL
jgi:excisionase family DNA binding protein